MTGTTLVTGATGFLGSRLVRRIRGDGSRIVCTTRSATPPAVEGVLWRVCDLTHARHVQALFEEERPSVVFHLASHVSDSHRLATLDKRLKRTACCHRNR